MVEAPMQMKNKKLHAWHSWFGVISGIFILMMGITGSILVFNKEIDTTLEKDFLWVREPSKINIDKALRTIQQTYPNWDTRIVSFRHPDQAIVFDLRRNPNSQRLKVFVHPSTGHILKTINANTHFTRWLLQFHYSLHSGLLGKLIILVVGILFLASLVTGLWLYRKSILKVLCFQVRVKHKTRRAFLSSIHRIVGTWALLLNLVMAITGTLLSYSIAVAALHSPKAIHTPTITLSIDQSLVTLKEELPDFQPSYIRIPTSPGAPITYYGIFKDDSVLWSKYYNSVRWDTQGPAPIKVKRVARESMSYKLASIVQPLHFGDYGGILIKLLYCFIGLSAPALSITGFLIWYYRKKKNKSVSL